MDAGIYEIVNSANGKRYVGSASQFRARFAVHRKLLRDGTHHSRHLQNAWDKNGECAFEFRRMLICAKTNLLMYEQRAIDALRPEYNICQTAGSSAGVKWSAEARARHSVIQRANPTFKGRKHSPETRAIMAIAANGRPSPTKGIKRSPDAISKTAEAHRGMKRSDETRALISALRAGKKMPPRSDAHRAALSAALKGRRLSREVIDKISAAKRGRKLSKEHKVKIGAASRVAWAKRKGIPC